VIRVAGNHTLGTIRGTIEIDYDGAGIVRATRDVDKLTKSGDKVDNFSKRVLSSFTKFASIVAKVGVTSLLTNGALQLVAGTLAVMAPLGAAAFAALPGLVGAAAGALAVMMIVTSGVGDALKSAGEGGAKFEKAMKKLSPEAQKFVKQYQKALPVLGKVADAMQDAFFRGTDKQVGLVATRIASLRGVGVQVAATMGQLVREVVKFATSTTSIGRIRQILGGVNAFLKAIKGSIGPVVGSFIRLAAQFGQFGGSIGESVNNALTKFSELLSGLDISEIFAKAAPIVQALGQFLSDIASIASSLFSVFNVDGESAAGVIGTLATQLATFLKSAEGASALAAIGQAMQAIASGAGQIFLALLQALAPTIVALAPGIAILAEQITALLVPALNAITPLLVSLAGFLSENMGWIGPLAGVVVALAGAYQVYAAAARAVIAVKALELGAHARSTAAWVANTASIVANRVAQVANAAITGGAAVAAWVANTAAVVASGAAMIAQKAVMVGAIVITKAVTAAQWLWNAAMTANPIGLVIALIVALVAGIILLWKNSETFRTIVLAVWAAIKTAVSAVVNWFMNTALPFLKAVFNGIVAAVKAMVNFAIAYFKFWLSAVKVVLNAIKAFFTAIWKAISIVVRTYITLVRTIITTVLNVIKTMWTTTWNLVRNIARTVWAGIVSTITSAINRVKSSINTIRNIIAVVRNAFNQARSAASNSLNSLVSLVRGLPGRVSRALGNLGSLLFGKGQSLVRGFINGISSMIGAVSDKARSVVHAVTKFLPGSPAEEGPLSGRGYALLRAQRMMRDMAKGIERQSHLPVAAMRGAIEPLARPLVASASGGRSGASTVPAASTPAVRSFGPYHLTVDGKVLTSIMVDAITGHPQVVAKANTEGSRQKSWAGSGR
jgi:phage-related protein